MLGVRRVESGHGRNICHAGRGGCGEVAGLRELAHQHGPRAPQERRPDRYPVSDRGADQGRSSRVREGRQGPPPAGLRHHVSYQRWQDDRGRHEQPGIERGMLDERRRRLRGLNKNRRFGCAAIRGHDQEVIRLQRKLENCR